MGLHVDEKSLMSSSIEGELRQQFFVDRDIKDMKNNNNIVKERVMIEIVVEQEQSEQSSKKSQTKISQEEKSSSDLKRPTINRHRSSSLSSLTKSLNLLQIDDTLSSLRRYHSSNLDSETQIDDKDGLLTTSLCTTEL